LETEINGERALARPVGLVYPKALKPSLRAIGAHSRDPLARNDVE
jgi:hypothetical protein